MGAPPAATSAFQEFNTQHLQLFRQQRAVNIENVEKLDLNPNDCIRDIMQRSTGADDKEQNTNNKKAYLDY